MNVNGLAIAISKDVYEPSDDTWLALEHLSRIAEDVSIAADLGCGTGVLGLHLAKERGAYVVLVDINPFAAQIAWMNAKANDLSHKVDVVQACCLDCIRRDAFDLVVFNPPYLPVSEYSEWIEYSWSGGEGGIEVVVRCLPSISEALRRKGVLLLILSSKARIPEVKDKLIEHGFTSLRVVGSKKMFFEELLCMEVKKQ